LLLWVEKVDTTWLIFEFGVGEADKNPLSECADFHLWKLCSPHNIFVREVLREYLFVPYIIFIIFLTLLLLLSESLILNNLFDLLNDIFPLLDSQTTGLILYFCLIVLTLLIPSLLSLAHTHSEPAFTRSISPLLY